ncbi:hypothetical protein HYC85_028615 [Camellia sinensis]|uniref:Tudor domain-containing protein n=1 Tax=Camellia sinensis TaxID=4442 RepID=A0A7J7FZP5_CAMSI|nr:hypothetical protein HYC85_028615 [Camellia sinensis]
MAGSSSPMRQLEADLIDAGNKLLMPPSSTYELLSLLDKVEHLLSRVDQAPCRSMQDALLPVMKALISQELLRHSNLDVKVSVVSCINEITRVTAPDAPYDDDQMKEIFKLTVMALEKLSLASGHCYTKAVSILDTIATVRSCLVMLDLECDELIVEMFHLFLNTIRSDHPPSVFSDMETIMTLVIEEIEEISLELLRPLLSSVKKENQTVSPLSWKLGENVFKKCADTLKLYLPQAVQFMRIDLNDYAEIVFSICQDASEKEHTEAKEPAPDAVCPGGAGPSVDGASRSVMNESTAQMRGTDISGDEESSKTLGRCKGKSIDARSSAHSDYLDSTKAVDLETEPDLVPKKRGRKPNSLIKPEEGYDCSWLSGGRKALQSPRHKKKLLKKVGSSSKCLAATEADQTETGKETRTQVSPKTSHCDNINISPSQNHSSPDGSLHTKGRPKKKGRLMNQDGDRGLLLVPERDLLSPREKSSQSAHVTSIKESEVRRDLKEKPERGSRKDAVAAKTNVQTIQTLGTVVVKEDAVPSDSKGKQELSVPQVGKKQSSGNTISRKHVSKESSGKMVSFSPIESLNKGESQFEGASKTNSKRKRTPQKEEVSEMPGDTKTNGEELVGCKIKVWWPLDNVFYEGAIYSFDPIEKEHRILYADGDEEKLDLTKERWVLLGNSTSPEQLGASPNSGQVTDLPSSDALSDRPRKKKAKTKSQFSTKQDNVVSSSKRFSSSGGASGGKSKVEGPKHGSKSVDGSTCDTLCIVDKVEGDRSETFDKLKDNERQKSDGKSKTANPRTVKKSRHDSSRSSKSENTQIVGESHASATTKQKNVRSEEALSGDVGKGKSPDSVDAQESEKRSVKKQQRWDKS